MRGTTHHQKLPNSLRFLSLFLVLTITFQPISYSFSTYSAAPFSLPAFDENLGTLESSEKGDSKYPTVILIQDAHGVTDTQTSIQSLIDHFQRKTKVQFVGVEGAYDSFDTLLYRNFPRKEMLLPIFEKFASQGEISGPTLAAVFNERENNFLGLEAPQFYEEGFAAYHEATGEREDVLQSIHKAEEDLGVELKKYFPSDFLKFQNFLREFETQKIDLDQFLMMAEKFSSEKTNQRHPHIKALLELLSEPRNEASLRKECLSLFQRLKLKLPKEQIAALNQKLQNYLTEQSGVGALAKELEEKAIQLSLSFQFSKEFDQAVKIQTLLENAKGIVFHDEIDDWIRIVESQWANTGKKRELLESVQTLRLFTKLAKLELSRKDWKKIQKKRAHSLFSEMGSAIRFYQKAEIRENIFYERMTAHWKINQGTHSTVLMVVGGFHTSGLVEQLQSQKVPYAVLSPKGVNVQAGLYEKLMKGEVSWAKDTTKDASIYEAFASAIQEELKVSGPSLEERQMLTRQWQRNILDQLRFQNREDDFDQYVMYTYIDEGPDPAQIKQFKEEWQKIISPFSQTTNLTAVQNQEALIRNPLDRSLFLMTSQRSELRYATEDKPWAKQLLEGVGSSSTDWLRLNTIASIVFRELKNRPGPVRRETIENEIHRKLNRQLIDGPVGAGYNLDYLFGELERLHLLKRSGDGYELGVDREIFQIKTNLIEEIRDDLRGTLKGVHLDERMSRAKSTLRKMLMRYAIATEQWTNAPVESRYPVLKAIALLSGEEKQKLVRFLQHESEEITSHSLMDAILLMLDPKRPMNWLEKNATNLKDRTLFYVSPETWLPIGGLGRVGQYHTRAAKQLGADVETIETMYAYKVKEGNLEKTDYSKLDVPVQFDNDGKPIYTYRVRVKKGYERVWVTVDVYSGVNKFGIKTLFIQDRPEPGASDPYFCKVPYQYGKFGPSATWAEYTEFISKASLKLIKMRQKAKENQNPDQKKPVLWTNDGQTGLLPVFFRMAEDLEDKSHDEIQALHQDGNWRDFIDEQMDLTHDPNSDAKLKGTFVWFTTHTFLNRTGENSESMLEGMKIPYFYRRLMRRVHSFDASSGGTRASDGAGTVAAMQEEGVRNIDPRVQLEAHTNGDDLEASSEEWRAIFEHPEFQRKFPGADPKTPTEEQLREAKIWAKGRVKDDPRFHALDLEFRNLNPHAPTFIYAGRLVREKAGLDRAFYQREMWEIGNIRYLIEQGANVVLFVNEQSGSWSGAALIHLRKLQQQIREGNYGPGRLMVASGWGPKEQRLLLAAADVQVNDSDANTEAAGFTETDGAVNGVIEVTMPGPEGIYQQQGQLIDLDIPGSGNFLVANAENSGAYHYVFEKLLQLYRENQRHFASYQVKSICLSPVLNALMTAASYVRAFSQGIDRHEKPIHWLKEYLNENEDAARRFQNEWLRRDLESTLAKTGQEFRDQSMSGGIRAFYQRGLTGTGEHNIVLSERVGRNEINEPISGWIKDRQLWQKIFEYLGVDLDDYVLIQDGVTDEGYSFPTARQILERGLPVQITGLQVLKLDIVRKGKRGTLFHRAGLAEENPRRMKRTILSLVPSEALQKLEAEPASLVWHVNGGFLGDTQAPRGWQDPGKYIVVSSGTRRVSVTLANQLDILHQEGGEASVMDFSLEAKGGALEVEARNVTSFEMWLQDHLLPFARKSKFESLRILQYGDDETMEQHGFKKEKGRNGSGYSIWTMDLTTAARSEVRFQTESSFIAEKLASLVSSQTETNQKQQQGFLEMLNANPSPQTAAWVQPLPSTKEGVSDLWNFLIAARTSQNKIHAGLLISSDEASLKLAQQFQNEFPELVSIVSNKTTGSENAVSIAAFKVEFPQAFTHGLPANLLAPVKSSLRLQDVQYEGVDAAEVFPLILLLSRLAEEGINAELLKEIERLTRGTVRFDGNNLIVTPQVLSWLAHLSPERFRALAASA